MCQTGILSRKMRCPFRVARGKDPDRADPHQRTIGLAFGPDPPTRCKRCYRAFGCCTNVERLGVVPIDIGCRDRLAH